MSFNVVIPARYAATRLPGKPLLKLAGKPMIQHVYERARQSGADEVVVATDDFMVRDACQQFGATVVMTSRNHGSGTDRIAEAVSQLNWADDTVVVNVQGDEPLMPPALIRQAAELLLADGDAGIATLGTPIVSREEFLNPNVVKLVMDDAGHAVYFSRAPIPWERDSAAQLTDNTAGFQYARRHIGIYAYRAATLQQFTALPPAPLETIEKLEQLRALWHGLVIKVADAEEPPGRGVDTAEDAQAIEALLNDF